MATRGSSHRRRSASVLLISFAGSMMLATGQAHSLNSLNYTVQGSRLASYNITNTPLGQARIAEFKQDTAQYRSDDNCVPPISPTYKAYDVTAAAGVVPEGEPDILIVQDKVQVKTVTSQVNLDGSRTVAVDSDLNSEERRRPDPPCDPVGPPWKHALFPEPCFERLETSRGWMDSCFQVYKIINDGHATHDFYAVDHWASFQRNSFRHMEQAWVESEVVVDAVNGATAAWYDWDPKSGSSFNCSGSSTVSVGLAIRVVEVGVERTVNTCEEWRPTKHTAPGKFKNLWVGDTPHMRAVAYLTAVSVTEGTAPGYKGAYGFVAA